jgi:hypothetical protein
VSGFGRRNRTDQTKLLLRAGGSRRKGKLGESLMPPTMSETDVALGYGVALASLLTVTAVPPAEVRPWPIVTGVGAA